MMNAIKYYLLAAMVAVESCYGEGVFGILGGDANQQPAFVYLVGFDGILQPINEGNFAISSTVSSVATSSSGSFIFGGNNDSATSPFIYVGNIDGSLARVGQGVLPSDGIISSVAINQNGYALAGGADGTGTFPPNAFLITPNGNTLSLGGGVFPANGFILSVALNQNNLGLIAGVTEPTENPIAYLVSSNGSLTSIGGGVLPAVGVCYSVALNDSGVGLIGGTEGTGFGVPNAFMLLPDQSIVSLNDGSFPSTGVIQTVAINASGNGLLGGFSQGGVGPPIAYQVFSDRTVRSLDPSVFPADGEIESVSINQDGVGLLGGRSRAGVPIAYLVSPQGSITILGEGIFSSRGSIQSVSMSDEGIGLIAGNSVTTRKAVAYLVSPGGILTPIGVETLPSVGFVNSTSVFGQGIIPKSFGPFASLSNTLFSLSKVFENHTKSRKNIFKQTHFKDRETHIDLEGTQGSSFELARNTKLKNKLHFFIADENEQIGIQKEPSLENFEEKPFRDGEVSYPWIFWTSFFGDWIHQSKEQSIPAYNNAIAGVVSAIESDAIEDVTIGGGLGYAFTYVDYSENKGHTGIHQEYLFCYSSWQRPYFYINGALWTGICQLDAVRRIIPNVSAKSDFDAWVFSPHLEMSCPFCLGDNLPWIGFDPFFMLDWANSWQGELTESSQSGLHIGIDSRYASMLRTELGVRFYQRVIWNWGSISFEEKTSYVNKAPFHSGPGTAFFVGAISSFNVETFSRSVQNLGVIQCAIDFAPSNPRYPYGSIDYQGEFGSSFQSHSLVGELGVAF